MVYHSRLLVIAAIVHVINDTDDDSTYCCQQFSISFSVPFASIKNVACFQTNRAIFLQNSWVDCFNHNNKSKNNKCGGSKYCHHHGVITTVTCGGISKDNLYEGLFLFL